MNYRPILENESIDIGVVQGILGMSWLEVTISGKGGHAGPTPMYLRDDAISTMTKIINWLNEVCEKDKKMILTVGKLSTRPNVVNCIPEEVTFTFDVRHPVDIKREQFINETKEIVNKIAKSEGASVTVKSLWNEKTTQFHPEIISIINDITQSLNYSQMEIYSGTGHDSIHLREITFTVMIFISSVDGISHVEHELSLDDETKRGANVILNTANYLAQLKKDF